MRAVLSWCGSLRKPPSVLFRILRAPASPDKHEPELGAAVVLVRRALDVLVLPAWGPRGVMSSAPWANFCFPPRLAETGRHTNLLVNHTLANPWDSFPTLPLSVGGVLAAKEQGPPEPLWGFPGCQIRRRRRRERGARGWASQ